LVFLGKIVKTRSNKGEVAVTPSPYFEACLPKQGEDVLLQSQKYNFQHKIEYFKEIRGAYILKFNAIDTISDAYKLIGYSLFSPQTFEEDTSFSFEKSIDFTVKDVTGNEWGVVKNAETFGINQVLQIDGEDGNVIYVPFAEEIVKEIDEEKKIIIIDPPDGLKELNKI
jgi:16S rRNA processing protein RimM